MAARFPDTESPAADEGRAAHWLATIMLNAATKGGLGFPAIDLTVGSQAPNGTIISREIYDGARDFHDAVAPLMRQAFVFGGPDLGIERTVAAPTYIHPESHGRVDFFLYDRGRMKLHIWDLKFGKTRESAFENWQLIAYAAGCVEELYITNPDVTISLNIFQPRGYWHTGAPDTWEVKLERLLHYIHIAEAGARAAYEPGAPVRSGDHCYYCPARTDCPAAVEAGLRYIEATTENVPLNLTLAQQAVLLRQVRRAMRHLKSLQTGLEEVVTVAARSGTLIPGFRLESKTGRLAWSRPDAEVLCLGEMLGVNLSEPGLVTPTQAKTLGIDSAIVDAMSTRQPGGVVLVEDDGTQARKAFQ